MNNRQRKILWFLFALILISVVVPPWRSYQIAKDYLPEETIYRLVFLGAPKTTTISHYRGFRIDSTRLILEWGCLILLGGLATLALAGAQSESSNDDEGSKARKENRKKRRTIIWNSWKRIQVWPAGILFLIACGYLPYHIKWQSNISTGEKSLGYFIFSTAPTPMVAIDSDKLNLSVPREHFRPKRQYEIRRDSLESEVILAQIEEKHRLMKDNHKTNDKTSADLSNSSLDPIPGESPIEWAIRQVKKPTQAAQPAVPATDGTGDQPAGGVGQPWTPGPNDKPWVPGSQPPPQANGQTAGSSQDDLAEATAELQRMQNVQQTSTPAVGGPWGSGPNPHSDDPVVDSIRNEWFGPIYNDSIHFVRDSLLIEDSIVYARMATELNANVSVDPLPASIQITLAALFLLFGLWSRKSSK